MVISFFEHEINQWALQLQDSGYCEELSEHIPNIAGMYMGGGNPAEFGSQEKKQDAMTQQQPGLPRLVLRNDREGPMQHHRHGNHRDDDGMQMPHRRDVMTSGRQDRSAGDVRHGLVPPNSKPVHLITPPRSMEDLKRQRTTGGGPMGDLIDLRSSNMIGDLVTDSISENNNSSGSVGSYDLDQSAGSSVETRQRLSSSGSGSSRGSATSGSLENAQGAAHRLGYSNQEVSQALDDLPPNWKTSDLISTLRRRRQYPESNSVRQPFGGARSQRDHRNTQTLVAPERSTSPYSDPGDIVFTSRHTLSQDKQQSSQPLPLTSLSQDSSPGSSRHRTKPSSSTAKRTETLRRRQMELLQSLGSQPVGRPPDVSGIYKSAASTVSSVPRDTTEMEDADDVLVLNDDEDMECVAALEDAEYTDMEHSQQGESIEYVHTTFPGEDESPDILLISPPRIPEPELVILDEDDEGYATRPAVTKPNVFHKISLAPTFTVPPQPSFKLPDMSRPFGAFPKQEGARPKHGAGGEISKRLEFVGGDVMDKDMDEPDSLSGQSSPTDSQPERKVPTLPAIPPLSFPHFKLEKEKTSEMDDKTQDDVAVNLQGKDAVIKQEQDRVLLEEPEVQEIGVLELIRNFQTDFESQKAKFEEEIRERTVNETLNMVSEQNEVMQRQMQEQQKQQAVGVVGPSGGKESAVTGEDVDEKLRVERKKLNEKQRKARQKMEQQLDEFKQKVLQDSEEMIRDRYGNMMQEQRDELQQKQSQEHQRLLQGQQEKFQQELQKMQQDMQVEMRRQQQQMQEAMHQQMQQGQQKAVAAAVEEDSIVIKPVKKGTPSKYRPIVIDGSNVAML